MDPATTESLEARLAALEAENKRLAVAAENRAATAVRSGIPDAEVMTSSKDFTHEDIELLQEKRVPTSWTSWLFHPGKVVPPSIWGSKDMPRNTVAAYMASRVTPDTRARLQATFGLTDEAVQGAMHMSFKPGRR